MHDLTPVASMEQEYFFLDRLRCAYILIQTLVKRSQLASFIMYDLASRYCKAQITILKSEPMLPGIHIKKTKKAVLMKEAQIWLIHKRPADLTHELPWQERDRLAACSPCSPPGYVCTHSYSYTFSFVRSQHAPKSSIPLPPTQHEIYQSQNK